MVIVFMGNTRVMLQRGGRGTFPARLLVWHLEGLVVVIQLEVNVCLIYCGSFLSPFLYLILVGLVMVMRMERRNDNTAVVSCVFFSGDKCSMFLPSLWFLYIKHTYQVPFCVGR